MKALRHFFILITIIMSQASAAQEDVKNVSSKIESDFKEGMLSLKATATNKMATYQELNYLFISIKKGGSGNISNNKQSGKFTLEPDESKILSKMNVNIQKNDVLKIYLYIKDEQTQKLISKDSLEINAQKYNDQISSVKEDAIFELKGLTIDETKTKIGKDFYDLFYMEYSKLPEKFANAITIGELPSMGRSSQISVAVEDKTVYNFMSNPSDDFLKEQANVSMKILLDYYQKKTLIKNEFKY